MTTDVIGRLKASPEAMAVMRAYAIHARGCRECGEHLADLLAGKTTEPVACDAGRSLAELFDLRLRQSRHARPWVRQAGKHNG